jgi:ABC-2 type transport system ATP-binding protein
MTAVIETTLLTKTYGTHRGIVDVDLRVDQGEVFGFLGPNGAGKTTTMRVILGLQAPSGGTVTVDGRRYRDIALPLTKVGTLLDAGAAHPGRSARLHMLSIAQSNGIGSRRVDELLELTGIASAAHRRVQEFSLGMKQRLGIAIALLGDPPILLFDEPVNGLDPEGIRWIRELLKSLAAEGRTVFVSSHLMTEMALTADRLIVIGRGRLLADATTEAFVEANARKDVFVRSPRANELGRDLVRAGATVVAEGDDALSVTAMDAPAIADLAVARHIPIHELTPRHASLEDAYLDLTNASVDYAAARGPKEGSFGDGA